MTQSLIIDPNEVRRPGYVKFPEVPVNQYTFDRDTEIARYGEKGMVQMLHDMIVVRTFESMLDSIKKTGAWQGVEYNHRGPAHLGIGQESAYVGQSFVLKPEDFIFGSHRSHGEILAKCYSAMHQMDEAQLESIMKGFLGGETLSYAEKIDYKDTALLRKFISDRGKIRARRVTGVSTQEQRKIARAVKNAREMALLPYSTTGR